MHGEKAGSANFEKMCAELGYIYIKTLDRYNPTDYIMIDNNGNTWKVELKYRYHNITDYSSVMIEKSKVFKNDIIIQYFYDITAVIYSKKTKDLKTNNIKCPVATQSHGDGSVKKEVIFVPFNLCKFYPAY
jgi:hypothetical protein